MTQPFPLLYPFLPAPFLPSGPFPPVPHNSRLLAFRPLLSKTVNRSPRIYNNTLKFPPLWFFVSPTLPMTHLAPYLTLTGRPCSIFWRKRAYSILAYAYARTLHAAWRFVIRSRCTSVVAAIRSLAETASSRGVRHRSFPTCWRHLPARWAAQLPWGTLPSSYCRPGRRPRRPAVACSTAVCRGRPTPPRLVVDRAPATICPHFRSVTPARVI